MSADVAPLFAPITLGPLKLSNRIVMAPMTRNFSPKGVPNQAVVDYYRRRAESGVGLIVTEGTVVNHAGLGGLEASRGCSARRRRQDCAPAVARR